MCQISISLITLIPSNPSFKNQTFTTKDIKIQGELKGIIRIYNLEIVILRMTCCAISAYISCYYLADFSLY